MLFALVLLFAQKAPPVCDAYQIKSLKTGYQIASSGTATLAAGTVYGQNGGCSIAVVTTQVDLSKGLVVAYDIHPRQIAVAHGKVVDIITIPAK